MRLTVSRSSVTRCFVGRKRAIGIVMALIGGTVLLVFMLTPTAFQGSQFYDFKVSTTTTKSKTADTQRYFIKLPNKEIFLYSAIVNYHEPEQGQINVIITGFDSTGTDSLQCCVLLKGDKLFTTPASVFYKYYIEDIFGAALELFKNAPTKAKQYACVVPEMGFEIKHVTLSATSSCPEAEEEYLPVIYPKTVPGGLALCAKSAFGDQLDPVKLIDWFEVQRLLGVDHVQLMDLHNPENVQKVFRYYKNMGFLDILPYDLPGVPKGRGLDNAKRVPQQVSHDETFPILDCKQRLRGYTYVAGHDMDEVVMPAKLQPLKQLMQEQLIKRPDAAGFYFYTQFFIYNWGPMDNKSDITFFRFLNSTKPRNECKKYIYLMNRVQQARTHAFTPRSPYQTYFMAQEDAILHHYRDCPSHVWSTCNPPRITDDSILRFKGKLEEQVRIARRATGTFPKNTRRKS